MSSRCTVTGLAGSVHVRLSGEVDAFTTGSLRRAFDDARHRHHGDVEVDAGEVTFMDSAGINVLLAAQRMLREDGRALRIVRESRAVERLLRAAGAERLYGETGRLASAP